MKWYVAGTNWLWEMLTLMKNNTSEVTGDDKGIGMLEALPISVLDSMTSPRILNSHLKVQYIPKVVFIYIYDPEQSTRSNIRGSESQGRKPLCLD